MAHRPFFEGKKKKKKKKPQKKKKKKKKSWIWVSGDANNSRVKVFV
jgi:hypothetical protein